MQVDVYGEVERVIARNPNTPRLKLEAQVESKHGKRHRSDRAGP